jgi:hypothetical protein
MPIPPGTQGDTPIKTLSLRLPADLHEQIERAASRLNIRSLNQFISMAVEEAAARAVGEISDSVPSEFSEPAPSEQPPLAILVDLDSFSGRPPINIDAIDRLASTLGRPVARYSFSTFGAADIDESVKIVLARYYRHAPLPTRSALRLRLAIEAMDLVEGYEIGNFLVVTGDEEFGFLSEAVRHRGGRVICVGMQTRTSTNPNFIRIFDGFRFYEQLDRPPESEELAQLRDSYVDYLILAALKFERRKSKAVGAALIPWIKARHPEASPELLELRNWRDLAVRAAEMGLAERVLPSGGDFQIVLTSKGKARAEGLLEETEKALADDEVIDHVSRAIAEILGIDLPPPATRFLVFSVSQWILKEEAPPEGLSLVEFSHRVTANLGATNVPQNTVYRLLNGLYRGGAFEYVPNPDNQNDPRVLHARVPVHHFDNVFVLNLLRILRLKHRLEAGPEALSRVIFGTERREARLAGLVELASNPDLDRGKLGRHLDSLEPDPG